MTAEIQQALALELDVLTVVEHLARGRLEQPQHHVRHGGLAGTGLAHNGQRGATTNLEAHVVDGLEHLTASRQLEFLGEMVDVDDHIAMLELVFIHLVLHERGGVLTLLLHGDDALRGQRWGRGHQTLRIGVLRVLKHVERGAGFHHLPLVHHDDMLGAFGGCGRDRA